MGLFWSVSANRAEVITAATRSLSIPYALFNCESGSYRWASQGHVKLLSQDRVKDLQEVIRTHIEIIPMYDAERGYNITVYEVWWPTPVWSGS